ncbi:hypothetical protein ACFXAZ_04010 [Streptomyces sp. NPDC059477]|uniref:hypothetical protein n=1 Tax=Streptomyces sp. NPDC059477 TaxID=3346847 RepID=UPI0036A91760
MSAIENTPEPQQEPRQEPHGSAGVVSMRDLLASCAAAELISTPPRAPEPTAPATAMVVRTPAPSPSRAA